MRTQDFDFHLPEELIAQFPAAERSASRLLHLDGSSGAVHDHMFRDLPALLKRGDLLLFNDTRVIKARLFGRKASGGSVEVLVERVLDERRALAHVRASRAPKPGSRLTLMKPPHSLLYKPPLDGRLIHDELQGTTLLQLTGKLA